MFCLAYRWLNFKWLLIHKQWNMSHLKMDELPEQTAWELWLPRSEHGDNIEARLEVCLGLIRFLKHTFRGHWSSPRICSHEYPFRSINGNTADSPAACGVLLRVNKELSANLQETRLRILLYTGGPESPLLSFAIQTLTLSPRDTCHFHFGSTVSCVWAPQATEPANLH